MQLGSMRCSEVSLGVVGWGVVEFRGGDLNLVEFSGMLWSLFWLSEV